MLSTLHGKSIILRYKSFNNPERGLSVSTSTVSKAARNLKKI